MAICLKLWNTLNGEYLHLFKGTISSWEICYSLKHCVHFIYEYRIESMCGTWKLENLLTLYKIIDF